MKIDIPKLVIYRIRASWPKGKTPQGHPAAPVTSTSGPAMPWASPRKTLSSPSSLDVAEEVKEEQDGFEDLEVTVGPGRAPSMVL